MYFLFLTPLTIYNFFWSKVCMFFFIQPHQSSHTSLAVELCSRKSCPLSIQIKKTVTIDFLWWESSQIDCDIRICHKFTYLLLVMVLRRFDLINFILLNDLSASFEVMGSTHRIFRRHVIDDRSISTDFCSAFVAELVIVCRFISASSLIQRKIQLKRLIFN